MNNKTKSGYIAGGIFLLGGIISLVIGIGSGWDSGKIMIIVGSFIGLLGGGSIWKPNTIGQVVAHYLQKSSGGKETKNISQTQKNVDGGIQTIVKDKGQFRQENHYYNTNLPEEDITDEKKLIKEINSELPKEKLSNILIKAIHLARLLKSKKDIFWLENEAYGFERNKKETHTRNTDHRVVNAEIRIASASELGYTPLKCKLALGMPIYEIEDIIADYANMTTYNHNELILRAPLTETLKKAHRETFGVDPREENVPYIIRVSEFKKIINELKLKISDFVNSISNSP